MIVLIVVLIASCLSLFRNPSDPDADVDVDVYVYEENN